MREFSNLSSADVARAVWSKSVFSCSTSSSDSAGSEWCEPKTVACVHRFSFFFFFFFFSTFWAFSQTFSAYGASFFFSSSSGGVFQTSSFVFYFCFSSPFVAPFSFFSTYVICLFSSPYLSSPCVVFFSAFRASSLSSSAFSSVFASCFFCSSPSYDASYACRPPWLAANCRVVASLPVIANWERRLRLRQRRSVDFWPLRLEQLRRVRSLHNVYRLLRLQNTDGIKFDTNRSNLEVSTRVQQARGKISQLHSLVFLLNSCLTFF